MLYICTATRSRYVKLDITGQNWKQMDSCMYLQSVAEKTLLIRVEANRKLQTLEIGIIKTAAGGRAVTVIYGLLLVAFSYNVEESGNPCMLMYCHVLLYIHTYMHIITRMLVYIQNNIHTCMFTYSYTYKPMYTHADSLLYINTYSHTYIYTDVHRYVRTFIPTSLCMHTVTKNCISTCKFKRLRMYVVD